MKTKFVIASFATAAAFASVGTAFAGELYNEANQSFSPAVMSPPVSVAGYVGGGELYPTIERQADKPAAITAKAPATPSVYATGGELFAPTEFGNGLAGSDTNMAE